MRQQEKPILENTKLLQQDPRITINLKQPGVSLASLCIGS